MPRANITPGSPTLVSRVSHPSLPYPSNRTGLFFDLDIPVRFDFDPAPADAEVFLHRDALGAPISSVRLDGIDFATINWRDLAETERTFPVNPELGYIDGSIYLHATHNYADATRLAFGRIEGRTMPLTIDITFDFSLIDASPAPLPKSLAVTWELAIQLDIAELDAQTALARRVLDKPTV